MDRSYTTTSFSFLVIHRQSRAQTYVPSSSGTSVGVWNRASVAMAPFQVEQRGPTIERTASPCVLLWETAAA